MLMDLPQRDWSNLNHYHSPHKLYYKDQKMCRHRSHSCSCCRDEHHWGLPGVTVCPPIHPMKILGNYSQLLSGSNFPHTKLCPSLTRANHAWPLQISHRCSSGVNNNICGLVAHNPGDIVLPLFQCDLDLPGFQQMKQTLESRLSRMEFTLKCFVESLKDFIVEVGRLALW